MKKLISIIIAIVIICIPIVSLAYNVGEGITSFYGVVPSLDEELSEDCFCFYWQEEDETYRLVIFETDEINFPGSQLSKLGMTALRIGNLVYGRIDNYYKALPYPWAAYGKEFYIFAYETGNWLKRLCSPEYVSNYYAEVDIFTDVKQGSPYHFKELKGYVYDDVELKWNELKGWELEAYNYNKFGLSDFRYTVVPPNVEVHNSYYDDIEETTIGIGEEERESGDKIIDFQKVVYSVKQFFEDTYNLLPGEIWAGIVGTISLIIALALKRVII